MTLSETSNDLDDERKIDLMDLDFCSFLDGECNDKLEGDESGFSSSRGRDMRDNNHLEYSVMSNYEDSGAGIEMDGKPVANTTFGSGFDQQGLKSMNGFEEMSEIENAKRSTQRLEQRDISNGQLQFTNNTNNNLGGTPTGHSSRPEISAQLHPQAIQSSAACPPHDALNIAQAAFTSLASAWGASPFMFNTAVESGQLASLKDGSSHSYFHEKTLPLVNSNTSAELYASFLASQKASTSNNSFAYEIPMSGFATIQDNSRLTGVVHCTAAGNNGAKNAKEQKRAKQITNLIEQLRVKMEKDGWKIEVNSKFHTLSSCARYLKHMKNANELKERAIEELKNQLEAKRLRVEDESAQQERSEPESTFSDLTDSSVSAKTPGSVSNGTGSESGDKGNPKRKTQRVMVSHQSTLSSSGSSGGENEGKTTVTDSSMSSSPYVDTNLTEKSRSSNTTTISSLNTSSEKLKLDFQEVFIKSNIPQLLATESGKIVTWNAFFLKVTGLEPKELQRLTIFSLVSSRELAKLFEFVAKALRSSSNADTPEGNSEDFSEKSAITLPCVRFPREANDEETSLSLSMTVTMMSNVDSRKQSFHVVFSDQVSNGAMGSIPPDLLGLLFAGPLDSNPLYQQSKRLVHKKRKQPA